MSSLAFKPDDPNILVTGSSDETVKLWDLSTSTCLSTMKVDAGREGVKSVSFSPKGDMVAAGCYNGRIYFVDVAAGEVKSSLNVDGVVQSVHWSPCGTKITAACNDYDTDNYYVKMLNSETGALLCALTGHTR